MKYKIGDVVQVIKTRQELFTENMYLGEADINIIAKVVALSEEMGEIALSVDGKEKDIGFFNLNSLWIKSSSVLPVDTINIPQPGPVKNDLPAVWDLVMEDMRNRNQVGLAKYGTPLQPLNGRDALVDAYQEALDLVVYLRQAIYEREVEDLFDESDLKTQLDALNEEFEKGLDKLFDTKTKTIKDEYCNCLGAVNMYEGSDGQFRCKKCVKRISKNF